MSKEAICKFVAMVSAALAVWSFKDASYYASAVWALAALENSIEAAIREARE